jgi:peroxiredoxin
MVKINSSSQHANPWVDCRLAVLDVPKEWQPDVHAALAHLKELNVSRCRGAGRWTLFATIAAAACLFIVALPSPKVFAHRCLECTLAAWQTISPSASVLASLKPVNGRTRAPDFTLNDANDKQVKLSGLRGKVVLVNFWATWCHGCQVEIPWFVEFQKKYEDRGLVVVGISMDDEGWKSVRPWLAEKMVNYPIVIGSESVGKEFGLDAMPLTVLVDRNGKIADVHSGLVNKFATAQKIRSLLEEKLTLSAN